jgi:hypothetical protein
MVGDGNRDLTTSLTRYYREKGTLPGFWIGSGVSGLGGGELGPGDEATEQHLRLLLGAGREPVTGELLGKATLKFKTAREHIYARVGRPPAGLRVGERADAITVIESEENARDRRPAVAGFDYTFSVPKSVSTRSTVADGHIQELIMRAHEAIAELIDLLEREVAMTRIGVDSRGGFCCAGGGTGCGCDLGRPLRLEVV